MTLLTFYAANFKALRECDITLDGENFQIYGDNGLGKTSILDAYSWCLTGKDSLGRAEFDIKPFDPESMRPGRMAEPLHRIDTTVRLKFQLDDGSKLELERTYREVWATERGKDATAPTGHTTEYRINTVPVTKGEYDARIASICPLKRLLLLSSVNHFNVDLDWKARRKWLIEEFGDVTDAEVMASADLYELADVLGPHTCDEYKSKLKVQRPKVQEAKGKIPAVINELQRAVDKAKAETGDVPDGADARAKLSVLQQEIATIRSGGQVGAKTLELNQLKSAQLELEQAGSQSRHEESAKAGMELRRLSGELGNAVIRVERLKGELGIDQTALAALEKQLEGKRAEYAPISTRQFSPSATSECPTCKQPLPQGEVDAANAKALAEFNLSKSKALELNRAEGEALKERVTAMATKIEAKKAAVIESEAEVELRKSAESQAKAAYDALCAPIPASEVESEALTANKAAQDALRAEIASLAEGNSTRLAEIEELIGDLNEKIEAAQAAKARADLVRSNEARIKELLAEDKALADQIEKMDGELDLIERFIRAKVSMLTDRINSHFKLVKFILFEELVNGALVESCEAEVGGVPYSSLNTASQINAGLDIINAFSEHWGFAAPAFVDRCESVTKLIPTRGQRIRLVVSAADDILRFEKEKVA